MSDYDLDQIAAKIAAIEALANDPAATDGEIAAATAAINRLLTKYNLDMQRVRALAPDKHNAETPIASHRYSTGARKRYDWEWALFDAIASAHFCRPLTIGHDYQFIGRVHNARAAIALFERLRTALAAMAAVHTTAYATFISENTFASPKSLRGAASLKTYRLSYLAGAVRTITDRLNAQRTANTQEFGTDVTALVLVEDAAIDAFLSSWRITKTRASTRHTNEDAYRKGRIDGQRISLHRADLND